MCSSALYLTILAASLAVCLARPADVLAQVPSNYYRGSKWVLFRDNDIPDPPANVIQHENGVQVLPTYRGFQQQQYPSFGILPSAPVQLEDSPVHLQGFAPIHVGSSPSPAGIAPVVGDHETDVVENHSAFPSQQLGYDYNGAYQQDYQTGYQKISKPTVQLTAVTVTAVPESAVHLEGPSFYDSLRKKKSV